MSATPFTARAKVRQTVTVLIVAGLAALTGACAKSGEDLLSASLGKPRAASETDGRSELAKATEYWQKRFQEEPQNLEAALAFARNLKAGGRKQDAFAVLQQASLFHSSSAELNSEYGRLALEFGQTALAARLLDAAGAMGQSDWKLVSAQGAAKAKLGQFDEAITLFETAHRMAPDEASVTNNLAMAYVAKGDLKRGEELLRRIALAPDATPRMRQNLSLVLGLQGRYTEAKAIAAQDKPADETYASVDRVKQMVQLPEQTKAPLSLKGPTQAEAARTPGRVAQR